MIKIVFCCRRRAELTPEDFQKRWLEVHGPLVKRLRARLPMMRRYIQSHTIFGTMTDALRASRGAAEPYDGITEVWFDGVEHLQATDQDALFAAQQLYEDEAQFIDFARSAVFLTEEHEIF
ncbi:MAG: EthD family reductase [Deltaproteobacteria bacterium]|nr:EthD family reductase [Deltaproteobacteria bacterium]